VNTYSSLVLRSMLNKQCNHYMQRSRPAVARPQDGLDRLVDNTLDEDAARVSDDGARYTSMSSARGDFGGFGGSRHRDSRHSSPSPVARGDARGGFGSRSHNCASSPSPAASGDAARGFDARARSDHDGGSNWKKTDFPTDEALRPCRVKRHEDLPSHIYLLLDILGLQFRWLLTSMGIGRTLVSSEELVVDDHKERAWMALYANDRDVIEDLLYCRLRTLWSGCTDAIAILSQHCVQEEFCAQKVWDALLTAFPLNHKRMQTVLLAREFSRLMAWDGHSKADVDRHFGDVSDTLQTLKFLERNIDITDVSKIKSVLLATLKFSKTKALTKAYASILDNLDDDQDLTFAMIQQACARKLRRGQDRGYDRSQDRRPATQRREHKDIQRHKDFTLSRPGDVSAFLCNFLEGHGIKPKKVLRAKDLPTADLHDAFALQALYEAASPYMPATVVSDTDSAATDTSYDSQASSDSDTSP